MTPTQLLSEIEEVIRTAPSGDFRVGRPEALAWLGRTASLLTRWNSRKAMEFQTLVAHIFQPGSTFPAGAAARMFVLLHEARHDLRLNEVGPLSVPLNQGAVFDYFDEIRKVMASARSELFFVDPYIDVDFASRYLSQVPAGVQVRLLTKKGVAALMPAVELARQQYGLGVKVRSESSLHDRFVFVDKMIGFQSGASFKDGARLSPTILTEITDAFQAVCNTYEKMWLAATQH